MSVSDLTMARFAKDGYEIAHRMLKQAEEALILNPPDAGRLAVSAWVVLNAVNAVCEQGGLSSIAQKAEKLRNKVRAMSSAFSAMGMRLETDIPDSQMAMLIKEGSSGDAP
jgi:hypothetical protein